jgi:hypothetical protein
MLTLAFVLAAFSQEVPRAGAGTVEVGPARLSRDDERLFVVVAAEKQVVTLSFNANGDGNAWHQIAIQPDGGVESAYREINPPWLDATWRPKIEVKAKEGTIEAAIPFASFHLSRKLHSVIGFQVRVGEKVASARLGGIPERSFPFPGPGPQQMALGPGSSHPGTTGEVRIELEGFLMGADPHARGVVWDLAVNEKSGELYVLSVPRVRAVPELNVFDREGRHLRCILPFNPTLRKEQVKDLVLGTATEGGTALVFPKKFEIFGAVETSLYGEWWHLPQKIAVAPDGDLILTNLYRGTVWRLHPDGSLPAEGWTSVQHPERNDPFEMTVDIGRKQFGKMNVPEEWYALKTASYLPFPEIFYPYWAFDPAGRLFVARGIFYKSSGLDSLAQYARYWEIPRNNERQLPETKAVFWSMKLLPGAKVDDIRGYGFDGSDQPAPPPDGVPGRKETSEFRGECGIAFDGDHLILSDRVEGKLRVFDSSRKPVKTLEGYSSPTAMAVDRAGSIYLLVEEKDGKKIQKLKSWREPEVVATSAPLHRETLQLALDREARIVWVANGDGLGSIVKLGADDLSKKGAWGDTGDALTSPVQQGYVPILNVDPETGDLFVEDDSHFRFGKRGQTYRLNPDGKELTKLPADGKGGPRLETLFGKDGKLYWWQHGKIWRYDRAGKPLPFAATGLDHLVVDEKVHHVGVFMGMDVDKDGTIYVVNAKSQVDVFDADGSPKKKALLNLNGAVRGIQVDAEGKIYTLSRKPEKIAPDTILEVYNNQLLSLAKYSSEGGEPIWSMPWTGITGRDQVLVWGCGCLRPRLHQALDEKGYLFVAGWQSVRVIDAATGKVVGEFGSYGNMDCKGKGSAYPHPELPLGTVSALVVRKDRLYIMDQLNRRIVKCRIVYGK